MGRCSKDMTEHRRTRNGNRFFYSQSLINCAGKTSTRFIFIQKSIQAICSQKLKQLIVVEIVVSNLQLYTRLLNDIVQCPGDSFCIGTIGITKTGCRHIDPYNGLIKFILHFFNQQLKSLIRCGESKTTDNG